MKIKFIALGLILFTVFGCCEDCKKELEIIKEDLKEPFRFSNESLSFDFCNTTEAITAKNRHNTRTGIAKFTVPIPRGSHLKLIKKDPKRLEYNCIGKVYKGDVFFKNVTVTGMSFDENAQIEVIVNFVGVEQNLCNAEILPTLIDPKKSIIDGEPK